MLRPNFRDSALSWTLICDVQLWLEAYCFPLVFVEFCLYVKLLICLIKFRFWWEIIIRFGYFDLNIGPHDLFDKSLDLCEVVKYPLSFIWGDVLHLWVPAHGLELRLLFAWVKYGWVRCWAWMLFSIETLALYWPKSFNFVVVDDRFVLVWYSRWRNSWFIPRLMITLSLSLNFVVLPLSHYVDSVSLSHYVIMRLLIPLCFLFIRGLLPLGVFDYEFDSCLHLNFLLEQSFDLTLNISFECAVIYFWSISWFRLLVLL